VLILVRHGESTGNASRRLVGRLDLPLTERGEREATALHGVLGDVARVVSSPLVRARQTAAALAPGLTVEVDDRWIEMDYGEHDGEVLADVPLDVWRRWRSDPQFAAAGGESLDAVVERVAAACEELFVGPDGEARSDDRHVVVVSHVTPIKAAVVWALGAGPAAVWRLYLATGSVTRLGWRGEPVVHSFNEVGRAASA